jgi:hypothetical protein
MKANWIYNRGEVIDMMFVMDDGVQASTGRKVDQVQDEVTSSSGNARGGTGQSNQYRSRTLSGNRASVYEAADILGVTVDAIRKRIQRGTIPHQRDEDGRVWVLLDTASILQDATTSRVSDVADYAYPAEVRDELVVSLKDQVEYLRQVIGARDLELQRKDSIIAALTQRIPELEPPKEATPEPQGSPPDATEEFSDHEVPPKEERRSWWRRFFFGP